MRITAISLLALATQSGCVALHAEVPEEVVRHHIAREEGIELAAVCSHEGRSFSEGAIACMAERRMTCVRPAGGCPTAPADDGADRWRVSDGR